jgi:hypothetical protein
MAAVQTAKITRRDLRNLFLPLPDLAVITDVKHLSSYNWIEAPTPTIAVPGSPALWSPPQGSPQLSKDSGLVYIAQNAARHPDYPLEPLFRALYISDPSFSLRSVDVVTDRNLIRRLLSFVNPDLGDKKLESFSMGIEIVKDTAMFNRHEPRTHEIIGPDEFRGFGHEFEKAYTKDRIKRSTGHHRIIGYHFGGLNFVIRHETDGYVASTTPHTSTDSIRAERDDLSSMLASMSLSSTTEVPAAVPGSKLIIRKEGETVALQSTLEVKTRVFHRRLQIRDVAPQLWASQTPKLVRAYHRKGRFEEPKVEDVTEAIKKWEHDNRSDLSRLAALIRKILVVVKELGEHAIMRYDCKGDKLIFSQTTGKMLPDDLYCKWDGPLFEAKVGWNP